MRVVAIVQARMGSTRLPGKVMLDLAGEPLLVRVVNRTRRAQAVREVVVATTLQPVDDDILSLCDQKGWHCFRGSEDDVLDRYYHAAIAYRADVIVRITSDCPLIEPEIVDRVMQVFSEGQPGIDYACNVLPTRTFPRGLDTEIISFEALERAWNEDLNPRSREHVTPYIYQNDHLFRLHGIVNEVDYSRMRWTVDTPEDLEFVRCIYDHFGHDCFSWQEVLAVLKDKPEWLEINRHVQQKVI